MKTPINASHTASMVRHSRLERESAVLILIDLQVGHMTAIQTIAPSQLRQNVVLLTQIANLYGVPVILTGAKQPPPDGTFLPEVTALLEKAHVIERTTVNAWDAPELVTAIVATGRRQLILAGVALEIGVMFPALSAVAAGYAVSVVMDAVGTTDARIESGAILSLAQAGVSLVSCASVGMALQKDLAASPGGSYWPCWAHPDHQVKTLLVRSDSIPIIPGKPAELARLISHGNGIFANPLGIIGRIRLI